MGMRDAALQGLSHELPTLLASIKSASGLPYNALHAHLAPLMGVSQESLKRSWLRWRQVSEEVNRRGCLPSIDSLIKLVAAAKEAGWLVSTERDGCGKLLEYLQARTAESAADGVVAAGRLLAHLGRQVQMAIDDRRFTSFDDTTWMRAMCHLVTTEVERALRERLLDGYKGSGPIPVRLKNELLTGTISKIVESVRLAASARLLALEAEVSRLEREVLEDFVASKEPELLTQRVGDGAAVLRNLTGRER